MNMCCSVHWSVRSRKIIHKTSARIFARSQDVNCLDGWIWLSRFLDVLHDCTCRSVKKWFTFFPFPLLHNYLPVTYFAYIMYVHINTYFQRRLLSGLTFSSKMSYILHAELRILRDKLSTTTSFHRPLGCTALMRSRNPEWRGNGRDEHATAIENLDAAQ